MLFGDAEFQVRKCGKFAVRNKCCRRVMPLSFQVPKLSVRLLQVESGLSQIRVSFEGECFVLVMWSFVLVMLCLCVTADGRGFETGVFFDCWIWRSLQIVCSKSSQIISDWLWWVHLCTY